MGRFCSVAFLFPWLICSFLLLGKTISYSLPMVHYVFLSPLVMSFSCSSRFNFDGGIVSNRGLFQSHYMKINSE